MLRAIARHGLILATGHLGRDDTSRSSTARSRRASSTIVVTHPEFPCQDFSIEDQVALAERGCLLERCLTHAAQRQDDVGARLRRRARGRRRAHDLLERPAATRTTRRSRTGSRCGPTACSAPASTRTRCARWSSASSRRLAGPMSRRLLVVGAHSRRLRLARRRRDRGHDRRPAARRRCSRSPTASGRVGRALEGAGPDRRAREGDPPRRGRARRGRARRDVRVPRPRRLPARDRRRGARRDRRPRSASSRPTCSSRTPTATRSTPTTRSPSSRSSGPARSPPARASRAPSTTDRSRRSSCSSSRTSPSSATSRRRRSSTSRP